MTDILVRNVEPSLKRRLAEQARRNGRSLSDETKKLLDEALPAKQKRPPGMGLGTWLSSLVPPEDWTDEFIVERDRTDRPPPDFS